MGGDSDHWRTSGDDHAGGAHKSSVEGVAGADDCRHGVGRDVGARLLADGLVKIGVKGFTQRADIGEAVAGESALEFQAYHLDAADEGFEVGVGCFGGDEALFKGVEHGDEVFKHAGDGAVGGVFGCWLMAS